MNYRDEMLIKPVTTEIDRRHTHNNEGRFIQALSQNKHGSSWAKIAICFAKCCANKFNGHVSCFKSSERQIYPK